MPYLERQHGQLVGDALLHRQPMQLLQISWSSEAAPHTTTERFNCCISYCTYTGEANSNSKSCKSHDGIIIIIIVIITLIIVNDYNYKETRETAYTNAIGQCSTQV